MYVEGGEGPGGGLHECKNATTCLRVSRPMPFSQYSAKPPRADYTSDSIGASTVYTEGTVTHSAYRYIVSDL